MSSRKGVQIPFTQDREGFDPIRVLRADPIYIRVLGAACIGELLLIIIT